MKTYWLGAVLGMSLGTVAWKLTPDDLYQAWTVSTRIIPEFTAVTVRGIFTAEGKGKLLYKGKVIERKMIRLNERASIAFITLLDVNGPQETFFIPIPLYSAEAQSCVEGAEEMIVIESGQSLIIKGSGRDISNFTIIIRPQRKPPDVTMRPAEP